MDYKQHKKNLRGQIKSKVERKLYNKRIRTEIINDNTNVIPVVINITCPFCNGSPVEKVSNNENYCPYCNRYW